MVELDTHGGAWTGGEALRRHDVQVAKRHIEQLKKQLEMATSRLTALQDGCEHRHTQELLPDQPAETYTVCQVCEREWQ